MFGLISCASVLIPSEQATFQERAASGRGAAALEQHLERVAASKEAAGVSQSLDGLGSAGKERLEAIDRHKISPEAASLTITASVAERPQRLPRVSMVEASRTSSGKGGRVLVAADHSRSSSLNLIRRQGILRPALGTGDEQVRTTLAGPESIEGRVRTATVFRSRYSNLRSPEAGDGEINAQLPSSSSERAADAAGKKDELLTLAYAPAVRPELSPFNHVLGEPKRSFVPPLGPEDHSWAATPLPASAFAKDEQTCLANGLYFEARGEEERGQAAVAQVILNRVRNPAYPDTICGVVYQNQSWKNRCQFSFACDDIADRITDRRAYETAELIGHKVTNGEIWLPSVGSATNYHATYVSPRWAQAMKRVDKIGRHIFYRTFGGGWD
ncbi:cell wall hydrolase [Jiella pacifica]|nr:cell wall hydrolase [Jiella pacifica]